MIRSTIATLVLAIATAGCAIDADTDDTAALDELEAEVLVTPEAAPTLTVQLIERCTNSGPLYLTRLSGAGAFRLEWFHHGGWHTMETSTTNVLEVYGSETQSFRVRGCRGSSCSATRTLAAVPC